MTVLKYGFLRVREDVLEWGRMGCVLTSYLSAQFSFYFLFFFSCRGEMISLPTLVDLILLRPTK